PATRKRFMQLMMQEAPYHTYGVSSAQAFAETVGNRSLALGADTISSRWAGDNISYWGRDSQGRRAGMGYNITPEDEKILGPIIDKVFSKQGSSIAMTPKGPATDNASAGLAKRRMVFGASGVYIGQGKYQELYYINANRAGSDR